MKRVTITIDPVVHEKGKTLARADRRDFSSYVEWLIKRDSQSPKSNGDVPHAESEAKEQAA